MDLEHSFTVPAGVATSWKTLLDVERIAMCMPGASLTSLNGDTFNGDVKVKLGPISMIYGGSATFTSKDEATHTVTIKASGSESKNTSTANATVVARLHEESPTSTRVDITTDLAITGKPAQFGRGVMQDVAGRIIGQFADNLAALIQSDSNAGAVSTSDEQAPAKEAAHVKGQDAINILDAAGAPVLKRALPIAGGVLALLVIWWLIK